MVTSSLMAGPAFADATASTTTTTLPASIAPPPALHPSQTFSLDAGQTLPIHGDGFTPGSTIAVQECGPSAFRADLPAACDQSHTQTVRADGAGAFDTSVTVTISKAAAPNAFTSTDATVTCPPRPYVFPGCVIVATNVGGRPQRAVVAVSLNGIQPPRAVVIVQPLVAPVTTVPAPPLPPPPAPAPILPVTGPVDLVALTVIGVLLLDLGACALVAGRPLRRS